MPMKTKFLVSVLLILCIFSFTSCSDDDKQPNLKLGDLPLSSQEFLTKYFPDNDVVSVSYESPDFSRVRSAKGEVNKEPSCLYVILDGNIYISFSKYSGDWVDISAVDGLPLSATKILDEHVYKELIRKERQAKITSLTPIYDHSITMTLTNGHRYAQTQLLSYKGTTLAEANITDNNVVSKITDFLKRNTINLENTMDYVFKITQTEGTTYRLFLDNVLVLSFDENVNWIHGEINNNSNDATPSRTILSKIAKTEIPASIYETINNSQINLGGIEIIASYGNGNYGFRFENKDLLVNKDTGIVPPPIAKANGVMLRHYDSSYKLRQSFNGGTLVGAYGYFTTFYYEKDEKNVAIEVNTNGDWISIDETILENGKEVSISLPSTIVDELPALAVKYLEQNYKDKAICYLRHNQYGYKGYMVYVDNRYQISFNEDGSYKTMVEIW